MDIDAAADCEPVHDIFVYTEFRSRDRVYGVDLKNPTAARVVLTETGDAPLKEHGNGWAWSDKRQAFLYWRRGSGVYEFKLVAGEWSTGTWRWTLLTSTANILAPESMSTDNGVYSRFRVTRWGNEEVAVVVNRANGPVYAFRIPEVGGNAVPVSVTMSASPQNIGVGGQSTLAWTSSNATGCTASGDWTGSKTSAGSAVVGPLAASSLFTLDCVSAGGATGRTSILVNVGTGVGSANSSPSIAGSPLTSLTAGSAYAFQPTSHDGDGDSLTFSIQKNLAGWSLTRPREL